jgi:hypothetical protein
MYWSHYGTPFGPSMRMLQDHWLPAEHLGGVIASPGRGVLVYQPWLILLCIHQDWSPWKWMLTGTALLHTFLISSWPIWWGGHCYGSRLMTEMVVVAALLILQPLDAILMRSWGRWLTVAFVLLGLAIHLPGGFGRANEWNAIPVAVDANPERLWDWSDPPMLYQFNH